MSEIDTLKKESLELMKQAGYPIKQEIQLQIDSSLPFMGYTTEKRGKTIIVISEWSLKTDMYMGLIIHELSHVYRTQSNHPSHNFSLHNEVLNEIFQDEIPAYQREIISTIINNLQDLYADDISFAVYIKKEKKENLSEFFMGWVREPVVPIESKRDRWINAQNLLGASFAEANLKRHHITDTGDKVAHAVTRFLSKTDSRQQKAYPYFRDFMTDLPENVTDQQFKKLLREYLQSFLHICE
jgi:hypothetical protein